MTGRIWIVTEYYYPDENATGYLMTKLVTGLLQTNKVGVVCRRPFNILQRRYDRLRSDSGAEVRRVRSTDFHKDVLGLRMINDITLSISIFVRLLLELHPGDRIVVVTNPPVLPYVTMIAALLKRVPYVVLVYDVYPEMLAAIGLVKSSNPLFKILRWMTSQLFRNAENVVVLGHDMLRLIAEEYPGSKEKLEIIPNWADTNEIKPSGRLDNSVLCDQHLENKFVVGYVGNIGRTHDIETLAECARLLSKDESVHFLFIGDGAKQKWLAEYVKMNILSNVTVLPFFDRTRQLDVHNACDLCVISFVKGMAGLSVPSRMYNMMAAGKPILAVSDEQSELVSVVQEEKIGWVVSSHNASDILQCIIDAKNHPEICLQMGRRARAVAVEKYSFDRILPRYRELLAAVSKERA